MRDGGSRPGEFWFDLGDVAVVPLVETAQLLIEPAEFFPDIGDDRSSWCFQQPWYDSATGRLVYTIQSFLVSTGETVVLVDACVGAAKPRLRPEFDRQSDDWLRRFAATGITAADVSAVVLTHLHVDHVGWATRADGATWTPVFDRARHYVTGPEFAYWTSTAGTAAMLRTGEYMADSVRPLFERGLLELVEPGAEIHPRVRLVAAPGHTPGNVCVQITGSSGELLLAGDLLHHPVQLVRPELSTRYCVDPEQATQTRLDLLAHLAESGTPLLPAHFPAPSAGRLVRDGAGYTFEAASDLVRAGQFTWRGRW